MVSVLGFSFSARGQELEDPIEIFHVPASHPFDEGDGEEFYHPYPIACYEFGSGLPMDCIFSAKIDFTFPSFAQSEQAKLAWGGGHLHTNNRPIGKIVSEPALIGDAISIAGHTLGRRLLIKHHTTMTLGVDSGPIPGAVTGRLKFFIPDQKSPADPDPNGRIRHCTWATWPGWHFPPGDTDHKTILRTYALYSEFPVTLTEVPPGERYILCNGCAGDQTDHPKKFSGNAQTLADIYQFSNAYDEMARAVEGRGTKVGISSVSLPTGGVLDTDRDWMDNPKNHRFGNAFDIRYILYDDDQNPQQLPDIDEHLIQAALQVPAVSGLNYREPTPEHLAYDFYR
jgi:hypothetical protein